VSTEQSPATSAPIEEAATGSGPRNVEQRQQFAVAMALGQRVSAWAKKNNVPKRTCYDWRKTKEYKATVEEVRRRSLDEAVGKFVRNLTGATEQIVRLAASAEKESVQLAAAKTVLREFLKVRKEIELEERVTELEEKSAKRQRNWSNANPQLTGWSAQPVQK
jgi:hypothetical protein